MEKQRPKVGTALVIFNDKNQVLFGKRTYMPTGYSMPGGHIEFLESVEDCCKREALEEVGANIEAIEVKTFGENVFKDKNYHSITIFAFCKIKEGEEPKNMEPEKCDGWEWFDIDNIPQNLAFNYDAVLKDNKALLKDFIK